MANILFVANSSSFLAVQIKNQLQEFGHKVLEVQAETNQIHSIYDDLAAIVIYPDDDMLNHPIALAYLKDKAIEDNLPVFAFGYNEELNVIKDYITPSLIKNEFSRPINVRESISTINQYLNKYGNQNKKKILVVDDSGAMLRNVKGWLEGSYNVTLANSGAMAIKYLSLNRPDLVLLDYEMPIVDGKQVLEMIRSEIDFQSVPVIFLTSKDDEESVRKVMELKVQGYLLKSLSPEQIVRAIDEFFERLKAEI